ncbi:SPW repeat protein, partial [Streptomyces prasinopilosus]
PWIVGTGPDAGVVWNNVVIGALTLLLGVMCVATASRGTSRT